MPAPTPRTSNRRAVYAELRRRVVSLDLPPGAPLSENELAAALGVSRTPVRESGTPRCCERFSTAGVTRPAR